MPNAVQDRRSLKALMRNIRYICELANHAYFVWGIGECILINGYAYNGIIGNIYWEDIMSAVMEVCMANMRGRMVVSIVTSAMVDPGIGLNFNR